MGRRGGDDGSSWTTIESDPGVFTELIEKIGVSGVQVEELWSTDLDSLLQLSPVYGLVFLFKWVKEQDNRPVEQDAQHVFFANQVIPNACATQAILSILLNIPPRTPGVSLGQELEGFREFTSGLPPDMRGLAISNSDLIRAVHNSFARPEPLVPDEDDKSNKGEDAFHFIAYLPVSGTLYELDGLKQGPIALAQGVSGEADWLAKVEPFIRERMERYSAGEVRFNLMALCGDRREALRKQIAECQQRCEALHGLLEGRSDAGATSSSSRLPTEPEGQRQMLGELQGRIALLSEELGEEDAKRKRWHAENVRRRHNYVPLLFNLVQALAEKQALGPFIEAARTAVKSKRAKQT